MFDVNCTYDNLVNQTTVLKENEIKYDYLYKLTGTVIFKRILGRYLIFLTILVEGENIIYPVIQIVVNNLTIVDNSDFDLTRKLNNGDIIGISGFIGKTIKSELSLYASSLYLLYKNKVPLNYSNILKIKSNNSKIINKSKILKIIKTYLDNNNYLEIIKINNCSLSKIYKISKNVVIIQTKNMNEFKLINLCENIMNYIYNNVYEYSNTRSSIKRLNFITELKKLTGYHFKDLYYDDIEELLNIYEVPNHSNSLKNMMFLLSNKLLNKKIIKPTFIHSYPSIMFPQYKTKNEKYTETFMYIISSKICCFGGIKENNLGILSLYLDDINDAIYGKN
jgi:lysyl-tRNA synthetase class II